MGLFFTKKFYCCLFVFTAFAAKAQVNFRASASPSSAGKNDYITFTLTVENADNAQLQSPTFADFNIVGGPNQGSSMTMMNGVTKQSVTLSYILQPKKSGNFHIGAASAIIGGKKYKSNAVDISVSNQASSGNTSQQQGNNLSSLMQSMQGFDAFDEPKPQESYDDYILKKGDNIPEKVNRNMQLKLQTDKTSCYVGEPVVATYKLYTRLKSQSTLSKNPSFNGFSVVDLTQMSDPGNSHTRESLNGRPYDAYIIRKAQLYPLQAGPVELETATLDNAVEFLKPGVNNYDPGNTITENVSLSSKPLTIIVKPLPEEGKPAGFKGAVGRFQITAALEKNSFSTDEAGKLLVTISGSGNMQLLTAPDVKWSEGLEAFDTKCTDNTDKLTIPVSGSKTFEIPFTVEKPGTYITPAISFSYFDPASASYKTITAPAATFAVSKGTGKPAGNYTIIKKEPVSLLNSFIEHRGLIIIFLAGIIICGLIYWTVKERKGEEETTENIMAEPTVENVPGAPVFIDLNPLSQTEDCLHKDECVEFYALLNGEIRQFLSQKFGIEKESLTVKTLAGAMDRAGIDNHIALQTQQLLQDIEWQLYTPFQHDERLHQMYAKAQTIVQLLNMISAQSVNL